MNIIKHILTITFIFLLAGCGGGDGGYVATPPVAPPTAATSMKLTVVLEGNAASVKGISATITLPSGIALNADAAGKVLSGVLTPATGTPSGSMDGKYTAASGSTPATVTVAFITSDNLAAGDFVILTADLEPGTSAPAITAFVISNSKLVDADGVVVSGASLALR